MPFPCHPGSGMPPQGFCPPMCAGMSGGFGPPPNMMMGGPMNMIPGIPAIPKSRSTPKPCVEEEEDGSTKITAELAAPFIEQLAKLGTCKQMTAEINGKTYNLKLKCDKGKKKKKDLCSTDSSSTSLSDNRNCPKQPPGPCFRFCDCNIPVPPGACDQAEVERRANEKQKKMNKNLSLCLQMMRELFAKNFDRQQAEDEAAVQMVEIPVMVTPPGGMGGGMPYMGGGMPYMGGGMPYMGAGMGGMSGMPCTSCGMRSDMGKDADSKPKVVCKTNRDQQCDESALHGAPKGKEGKGGKKGKGGKGGKGGKKGKKGKKK